MSKCLSQILNDSLNLELLRLVCSGEGVEINISELSQRLNRHRNTVAARIEHLFSNKIIEKPFHPFPRIFTEYPLLVFEKANLPRNQKTNKWIEHDPHIWAAFFVKDEEYNSLLIELHENLHEYQKWRSCLIGQKWVALAPGQEAIASDVLYLSTQAIIKNDPANSIALLKEQFLQFPEMTMNGIKMDKLYLNLIESLVSGIGVWTNPNSLARKLNVHRVTVQRRLDLLLKEGIISPPTSRFPRIWAPPEYFIVFSLIELKKDKEQISNTLKEDPHTSLITQSCAGKYNLVTISCFSRLRDHLTWEEKLDQKFSGSLGSIKNLYLSPSMTFSIHQQFVPLEYLRNRLDLTWD